jgi:phage/plasmid-like protein (TIGR03299 family)
MRHALAVNRKRGKTNMAHEVETMMFAGDVPWHGLGIRVESAIDSNDAIRKAGLDWTVSLERMFTCEGIQIDTHRAVRRETDGKVLGVVGNRYKPLDNAHAFAWFDPFVRAGMASYEAAGSLRGGARVFVLAKLNREDSVIVAKSDDRVQKFLLLSNGHDGSLAIRVGFTPVRVVCANTLAAAHGDHASKLIRIRHSGDVVGALDDIRTAVNTADAEFEATAEQYRTLARHNINAADLRKYVSSVFELDEPSPKADGTPRASRVMEAVTQAFDSGAGNDLPGVKGTWWAAYNAVTDYLSHTRGTDSESRLDSQWYGDSAAKNTRALQYAYQMVA